MQRRQQVKRSARRLQRRDVCYDGKRSKQAVECPNCHELRTNDRYFAQNVVPKATAVRRGCQARQKAACSIANVMQCAMKSRRGRLRPQVANRPLASCRQGLWTLPAQFWPAFIRAPWLMSFFFPVIVSYYLAVLYFLTRARGCHRPPLSALGGCLRTARMNPLTQVKNTQKITRAEFVSGVSESASWHAKYKHSAYVFVGGLDFELTEGDVLAVMAQYGEVVDINLVRDKTTNKSRGFAFIAYEDQRSTVLAVDNLSGAKVSGRKIRVEHVDDYKKHKQEVRPGR